MASIALYQARLHHRTGAGAGLMCGEISTLVRRRSAQGRSPRQKWWQAGPETQAVDLDTFRVRRQRWAEALRRFPEHQNTLEAGAHPCPAVGQVAIPLAFQPGNAPIRHPLPDGVDRCRHRPGNLVRLESVRRIRPIVPIQWEQFSLLTWHQAGAMHASRRCGGERFTGFAAARLFADPLHMMERESLAPG